MEHLLQFYIDQNIDFVFSNTAKDYFKKSEADDVKSSVEIEKDKEIGRKNTIEKKFQILQSEKAISIEKAVNEAEKIAKNSNTLSELQKAVEGFDGCLLKAHCKHTILGYGNENPQVLFVLDALSKEEEKTGKALVGNTSEMLKKLAKFVSYSFDKNAYVSFAVPWWPLGDRAPTKEDVTMCLPFLKKQIELIKPKAIVFLGSNIAQAVMGTKQNLMNLRNKVHKYKNGNAEVDCFVSFAPSYLIKNPLAKKLAMEDFVKIEEIFKKATL